MVRLQDALAIAAVLGASAAGFVAANLARAHREAKEILYADDGAARARCPAAASLGHRCAGCVAARCCAEITACYATSTCIDLNDCWVKAGEDEPGRGGEEAAAEACERRYPAAVPLFRAWDACARRSCTAECPRGPDDE